jgi:hypothetical protein
MEKFSVYSDKTTGISPFLPVSLKPTILTYIFHSIIIPLKIIMFIPVLILLPLLTIIPTTSKVIIDVILAYFFNVSETELVIDGVRKSDELGKLTKSPKSKDIIIVNANGPLDWFVWKLISENSSDIKVGIATSQGIIVIKDWKSWINWCFNGSLNSPIQNETKNDNNLIYITDIDASSTDIDGITNFKKIVGNSTLYVVIEGTITNGKGILQFPIGFDACAFSKMVIHACYGFKVMSTKVSPVGITETVLKTNKWRWLFLNFGSLSMNIKYKMKLTVFNDTKFILDTVIREKLASNGRMKLLGRDMDVNTKRKYVSALQENENKNK